MIESRRERAAFRRGRWILVAVLPVAMWVASMGFAASAEAASPITWSEPYTADPPGNPPGWTDITCSFYWQPTNEACTGTDSEGRVDSSNEQPGGGPTTWSKAAVAPYGVTRVSCPGACVGIDDHGDVITSPSGSAGPWTTTPIDAGRRLGAVACTSDSFCIVVDDLGNAFTSTDPTGGVSAWSGPVSIDPQPPGGTVDGLSCVSTSLCVAVDSLGGVVSSSDPTGGSTAWKRVDVDGQIPIRDVSCPTTSLCVAIAGSGSGQVLTSSDPVGDAAAWQVESLDGSNQLNAVSCDPDPACGAVDDHGNVLTTTDPAAGAASWSAPVPVDPGSSLVTISCVGGYDGCVAGDTNGRLASGYPGSSSDWSVHSALGGPYTLEQMSCPSAALCVAIDNGYREVSSTDPAAGSAWSATPLADFASFQNGTVTFPLSCPSTSLCVSLPNYLAGPPTTFALNIMLSTSFDPAAGGTTWSDQSLYSLSSSNAGPLSCASSTLCAAAYGSQILTSSDPTQTSSWQTANFSGADNVADVSCVTGPLCVAVAGDQVATSTDPTGTGAWTMAQVVSPQSQLVGVWCSSPSFCAALDNQGNVLTSTDPTGGSGAWTLDELNLGYQLYDLRCPAATLCVALGPNGKVVSSTDPTGPSGSWQVTTIDPGGNLTSVSCASAQLCIVGDADGNVIAGTAPPSPLAAAQGVPAPVLAKRFTLTPLSGRVLVKPRGGKRFRRITTATSFAFGATVDVTHGRARITVARRWHGTRTARLWGGVVRLNQNTSGLTTATLTGRLPGCRPAARRGAKSRWLWANATAAIRTSGRYAGAMPAAARKTTWLTQDGCKRTSLRATKGTITVVGLPHHKRLRVPAGHRYVADQG